MVERKTRPAPLTLVARKSFKPAGKPGEYCVPQRLSCFFRLIVPLHGNPSCQVRFTTQYFYTIQAVFAENRRNSEL